MELEKYVWEKIKSLNLRGKTFVGIIMQLNHAKAAWFFCAQKRFFHIFMRIISFLEKFLHFLDCYHLKQELDH